MKLLAEKLKDLSEEQIVELAKELIGHKIGLTINHKPVIHPNADPLCAPGYYYDRETNRCILDIGG